MIKNKKELKEYIEYEKKIYKQNSFLKTCVKALFGSEKAIIYKFQRRLRKTEYYYNSNKKLRYILSLMILNKKFRNKYSLHIPLNTCGKGLRIMHLGSILINGNAKLGKDVTLHINTSIVAQGVTDEVPTIGNGVGLGVGATIVGGITLANYIAVGANSVVTHSFYEENIAIAGSPAKKISNNGRKNWSGSKVN